MSFCGKCGAPVPNGCKFCPKCGNPLAAPQNQAQQPASGTGYTETPNPQPTPGADPFAYNQPNYNSNAYNYGQGQPEYSYNQYGGSNEQNFEPGKKGGGKLALLFVLIAAGIAAGLGYGENTKAALIPRGLAEIARLGISMGGRIETFYGLTGIGDLIVTCASMHSRNRRAGILIGKGATMEEAMKEVKMVVEGVYSAKAGYALSQKYHVSMPIIEQVNKVLFEGKSASEAVGELMLRDKKVENIDLRQLYQNDVKVPW